MVIHGHVKVNGKKMIHPGYMLNPGDLFAVDVDTVLWATGRPKPKSAAIASPSEEESTDVETTEESSADASAAETTTDNIEEPDVEISEDANDPESIKQRKSSLRSVREIIDNVIDKVDPSAARKRELRALRAKVNPLIGHVKDEDSALKIKDVEDQLTAILTKIEDSNPASAETSESNEDLGPTSKRGRNEHIGALARLYSEELPLKQYEQPWVPRDWMAPFAFVPRYLEVNYTICSAVYLRHPVARPGLAEVPTPFGMETGALAHNWYLRRR